MTPDIIEELNSDRPSDFCATMMKECLSLMKRSRCDMAKRYDDWDLHDQVYRGLRVLDSDDIRAELRGKPTKMIVPNTFAQVQTFVSFLFLMFNQNRTFFELQPTGDEDSGTKQRDSELVLERDLKHNMWNTTLYQHLVHTGVFGMAPLSCEWGRKTMMAKVTEQPMMVEHMGMEVEVRPQSEWREYLKFEGNVVKPVSPYRFFPDTRLPLTDLEEGEFCAWEEEYSMVELRALAKDGVIAGIDKIQPLQNDWTKTRGAVTRTMTDFNIRGNVGGAKSEGMVLVSKMRRRIVPSKFKFGPKEKALGPEEFPVMYHIWWANDNTIIRCEPAEEWHGSFGVTLSQFTPDMHDTLCGVSLAGLIYRLQDVISFAINSHVKEIRTTLQNRRVINQELIETKSLDGEGDIFMRKNVGRRSVQEALMQLPVTDVTGGHMSDAQMLTNIIQMVTGVNDMMQGQYSQGRRDATQSRNVAAGAAGRMKMHGHLIWDGGLGPLGRMMLSNSRQSLSQEMFARIIGSKAFEAAPERYPIFKGTPEEVICADDFFVFDSTMSSEKGLMAQSLQELLSTILTANPQAALQVAMRIDPTKIVDEIQYLRTGTTSQRFHYDGGVAPVMPTPQLLPQPGTAPAAV